MSTAVFVTHKREHVGQRSTGIAHQWFASYLTSRTQSVCLCRTKSQTSELPQGVPQGSVLGPVLFTLYTGPIGQVIRHHQLDFPTFADDSQLCVSLTLRGRHTVRFSRTNQSIVRVAGDTRVSETGRSYDIEFRTCSKLLPMISDERRDSQSEGSSLAFDLGSSGDLTRKNHGGHYG